MPKTNLEVVIFVTLSTQRTMHLQLEKLGNHRDDQFTDTQILKTYNASADVHLPQYSNKCTLKVKSFFFCLLSWLIVKRSYSTQAAKNHILEGNLLLVSQVVKISIIFDQVIPLLEINDRKN